MIFVAGHLSAVAAPSRPKQARPRFLVSLEGPTVLQPNRDVIASYRIEARKSGASGLRKVASAPFVGHALRGSQTWLPQPGTPRFAVVYRPENGGNGWIDVWRPLPLARIATIPCQGERSVNWLAGRDALAVVERVGGQYRTRVVDVRGRTVLSLDRCLGIVAAPENGGVYVARYAPSIALATLDEILSSAPSHVRMGALLTDGRAWFEAYDRRLGRPRRLTVEQATRALFGRRVMPQTLAALADPQRRPCGFAGHWLLVRVGEKGFGPGHVQKVYDMLLSPKGSIPFVRTELNGGADDARAVALDGSLLFSGRWNDDPTGIKPDGTLAARLTPEGLLREWRYPPVGNLASTVVLWDSSG